MPGRTEAEAVARFLQPIQDAIGCFADGKVLVSSRKLGVPGILNVNRGNALKLPGECGLTLDLGLKYELIKRASSDSPWKVTTTAYYFHLDDRDGELFAFHWHPDNDRVQFPHVHVRGHDEHIPTGRVFLEDVLRLAVELKSTPRNDAWSSVLETNTANVAKSATWGVAPPR